MKKSKLNKQVTHINKLFLETLTQFNMREDVMTNNIVFATQPVLSKSNITDDFSNFKVLTTKDSSEISSIMEYDHNTKIKGRIRKVRTGDGIHFTTIGQKRLASTLMHFINVDVTSS